MKNIFKQLTAGTAIALLLLVGNVKAEGTEKIASKNENIETTLQLEKWMTDETIWNTNTLNRAEFVQETETSLELEKWMTSEATWNQSIQFIEETDEAIELEDWMINSETWNAIDINVEQELRIENWMINSNYWK